MVPESPGWEQLPHCPPCQLPRRPPPTHLRRAGATSRGDRAHLQGVREGGGTKASEGPAGVGRAAAGEQSRWDASSAAERRRQHPSAPRPASGPPRCAHVCGGQLEHGGVAAGRGRCGCVRGDGRGRRWEGAGCQGGGRPKEPSTEAGCHVFAYLRSARSPTHDRCVRPPPPQRQAGTVRGLRQAQRARQAPLACGHGAAGAAGGSREARVGGRHAEGQREADEGLQYQGRLQYQARL